MSALTDRIVTEHRTTGDISDAHPHKVHCTCGTWVYMWGDHLVRVTEQAALASAARKVNDFTTGLARGLDQFPAGESEYIDGTNDTLGDVVEALGKLARLIAPEQP